MEKRRALLLSDQRLFGESLEYTLRKVEDLEVTGPCKIDDQVLTRLDCAEIDLIIIAEDGVPPELISRLTAEILERHPDLPVFRVTLEKNSLQMYSSHSVPARSSELINLIHRLPGRRPQIGKENSETR